MRKFSFLKPTRAKYRGDESEGVKEKEEEEEEQQQQQQQQEDDEEEEEETDESWERIKASNQLYNTSRLKKKSNSTSDLYSFAQSNENRIVKKKLPESSESGSKSEAGSSDPSSSQTQKKTRNPFALFKQKEDIPNSRGGKDNTGNKKNSGNNIGSSIQHPSSLSSSNLFFEFSAADSFLDINFFPAEKKESGGLDAAAPAQHVHSENIKREEMQKSSKHKKQPSKITIALPNTNFEEGSSDINSSNSNSSSNVFLSPGLIAAAGEGEKEDHSEHFLSNEEKKARALLHSLFLEDFDKYEFALFFKKELERRDLFSEKKTFNGQDATTLLLDLLQEKIDQKYPGQNASVSRKDVRDKFER